MLILAEALARPRLAWEAFAQDRGLHFVASLEYPADPLAIDGRVHGIDVALVVRRTRQRRSDKAPFETIVRAQARYALLGRLVVHPTRWIDRLLRLFRAPATLGDASLDAELTVKTSSSAILETVADETTLGALRVLTPRSLIRLAYENGVIAIRWSGAEETHEVLDAALKLVTHLAVTGSEVSPYR